MLFFVCRFFCNFMAKHFCDHPHARARNCLFSKFPENTIYVTTHFEKLVDLTSQVGVNASSALEDDSIQSTAFQSLKVRLLRHRLKRIKIGGTVDGNNPASISFVIFVFVFVCSCFCQFVCLQTY